MAPAPTPAPDPEKVDERVFRLYDRLHKDHPRRGRPTIDPDNPPLTLSPLRQQSVRGGRCHGTNRHGKRCKRPAIHGGRNCRWHNRGTERQSADRRVAMAEVQNEVRKTLVKMKERGMLDLRGVDKHPIQHLVDELYLSAGVVSVLGQMVGELEDITQFGKDQREQHVLFRMWSEERDRHARIANMALKAGVAERQVRIAEQQAELVAGAIRGILQELGVEHDPRVPSLVRRYLLQASAGETASVQSPNGISETEDDPANLAQPLSATEN